MARINSQDQFRSAFQGSATSQPYDPVKAFDNSHVFEQKGKEKIRDIDTLVRMGKTQYELDLAYHKAKKEETLGRMKLEQARANANWAAVKGLISLSGKALGTFQEIQKMNEIRADEDALLASIGWGETDPTESIAPGALDRENERDVYATAEAQGTSIVAREYQQEGTVEGLNTSNILQQSTQFMGLTAVDGNGYRARSMHGGYLSAWVNSIPEAQMPRTEAEARALLMEANRYFLRNTGMLEKGVPRKQLLALARQMSGNTQNAIKTLVTAGVKQQQRVNLEAGKGFISNLTESGASPEEVWDKGSQRYAYGNLGYTGYSRASNQAALENILQEYAESGDVNAIRRFRLVNEVPGNNGTKLGTTYDHLFDKYEKQALTGAVQDYNNMEAYKNTQTKLQIQDFYDNPTPENRRAAVNKLRAIGSEWALNEADRLSANGLGYDPQKKFELAEMVARGEEIPMDTLKQLAADGTINADEYKQYAKTSPILQAEKQVDEYIDNIDTQLRVSMAGTAGPQALTPEVRAQLTVRHQAMVEDLRNLVMAEVKQNPAIASDKRELTRIIEAKTQYLLQQPHYKIQSDPQKGYYFPGDFKADNRLAKITVAPGIQDFSKLTPKQALTELDFPKSEMDPLKDRFLSIDSLKTDVKRLLDGKDVSAHTKEWAAGLGLSPRALIDAQLEANGLPTVRAMQEELKAPPTPAQGPPINYQDISGMQMGQRALMELGVPRKGAAYLSGNIQQESGWSGNRPAWDDLGAPAAGLVSWRAGRLQALERHFGKPVTQISEGDQLKYMLSEMKRSYPSAYRTFMNPNATDAALKKASYQFWGYGEEGKRYGYAQQLLRAQTPKQNGGFIQTTAKIAQGSAQAYGMDTSAGPDRGINACAWAVNKVLKAQGISTPWGSSVWVPTIKDTLDKKGKQVSGPVPGAIAIMQDNGNPPYPHIGIVQADGRILSNSSRSAKFNWLGTPQEYERKYGRPNLYYVIS